VRRRKGGDDRVGKDGQRRIRQSPPRRGRVPHGAECSAKRRILGAADFLITCRASYSTILMTIALKKIVLLLLLLTLMIIAKMMLLLIIMAT